MRTIQRLLRPYCSKYDFASHTLTKKHIESKIFDNFVIIIGTASETLVLLIKSTIGESSDKLSSHPSMRCQNSK